MSEHKLHNDFKEILNPLNELPHAKMGQAILVVEDDPKSACGFVVEFYHYHPKLKFLAKGWMEGHNLRHPMALFHWARGNQKDRIIGWAWVTK